MRLWFASFVLIALLAFIAVTFNELVVGRNGVRKAWSDIDVQLQRRHDLVPQLVAVVKGYAEHERNIFDAVAQSRAHAQASDSIATREQAETELAGQLSRVLALQENYPDLKASANFLQLQRDLVETEDRLQTARSAYNEAVRGYNVQIQNFPEFLLARLFGFRDAEYFQAQDRTPARVNG
jgi:LemA protein